MDLVAALADFRQRQARASNRQEAIQRYCCTELAKRGVLGAEIELPLLGRYRVKKWDVGLVVGEDVRLAISCKSIISNHGGTVPNRVDDMLGEAVSLHRNFPKAVLGYLFMMSRRDESQNTQKRTLKLGGLTPERLEQLHEDADEWFDRLVWSVARASGRDGENDLPEKFEVVSCSQVDFDSTPYEIYVHGDALDPDSFFDRLAEIYFQRFGTA